MSWFCLDQELLVTAAPSVGVPMGVVSRIVESTNPEHKRKNVLCIRF